MTEAIIARDVKKLYGNVEAVSGISFHVAEGECFGLLGPNGAGKTSTLSMIRCFSRMDGGQLKVLGRDANKHARMIRSRIGVVPQDDTLDPDLTVVDNLLVYARYFGIKRKSASERVDELLRFMSLQEKASVRPEHLSGGMKKRLLIARALINKPDMLILDEPTTGLDPQARHHIWQRINSLKAAGTTMLLCTHYMDEAEYLCDRIAVMDHGKILAQGSCEDLLLSHAGATVIVIRTPIHHSAPDSFSMLKDSMPEGARIEYHGDCLYCFIAPQKPIPTTCLDKAREQGLEVTTRPASLEDVFLNLTGRELRE